MELSGKRIMVTGGSGFVGSHLVDQIRGHEPAEIIIPRSAQFDLTDARQTADLLATTKPDLIFHLAASVGGIGANRKYPGTFFYDNMAMGLNVLEQARRHGTEKVVVAGTICAYPKFAEVPFREDAMWDGYPEETNAPYGVAKKALLVMAEAYRAEFGCNFVVLFPVNLYGPRDNFDLESSHVIPAMIRKFITAEENGQNEVHLWGDGSPTREFLYAEDCATGFILGAQKYDSHEPVNLGTGTEISIKALAEKIGTMTGYSGSIVWDESQPNGQPRRCLDVTRARERFGFEAPTGLDEGLAQTIAWWRENKEAVIAAEAGS